jgi:hypothetical protein
VIEQISVAGLPIFIPEMSVVAFWKRDATDPVSFELDFVVKSNSKELRRMPVRADFGTGLINRTILNFQGVVVEEPGVFSFAFMLGAEEKASYSLAILPPATTVVEPAH